MKIVKKEILEFSEKETDAIQLVSKICIGLMQEASDPNLKKLAEETYNRIVTLWGYEEQKDGGDPIFFLCILLKNFFQKGIDKCGGLWYNRRGVCRAGRGSKGPFPASPTPYAKFLLLLATF